MNITVERFGGTVGKRASERQEWRFYVMMGYGPAPLEVVLAQYLEQDRPSPRHKWVNRQGLCYNRTDNRSYYGGFGRLAATVPVPDDVKAEVVKQITDGIIFKEEKNP